MCGARRRALSFLFLAVIAMPSMLGCEGDDDDRDTADDDGGAAVDGGGEMLADGGGSSDARLTSGDAANDRTELGDGGNVVAADAQAACVPESHILATVGPNGGSDCSFDFTKPYTAGQINLLLSPGWGTVCHAGSSQNCGSGASADGWWLSGNTIYLCDATCSRFYRQTRAGRLTVQLGCPTKRCMHR